MKLITVGVILGVVSPAFPAETNTTSHVTPPAPADTYAISYDTMYDQRKTSLSTVTCSTGQYGLLTLGYNTFGDLPHFPFIGGAPQIDSWDSPYCGTCWELTYTDSLGISFSLSLAAINAAQGGFDISLEGLNGLTSGNALTLDGVSITAVQVSATDCGLIPPQRV